MSLTFALQALLVRHEAYVAGSERDRTDMAANVERLEKEKRELQKINAYIIRENRKLLDKLEKVNGKVAASDAYTQSLASALEATNLEVRRLTHMASRAETLERQLLELEVDQADTQNALGDSRAAEKSLAQRLKRAEQTVASLQDQNDRIEREAMEERERHDEMISHMSRRNVSGRSNGSGGMTWSEDDAESTATVAVASAGTCVNQNTANGENDVTSHFLNDVLEDNANLRKDVVELRQMLLNANVEMETLREQFMHHQPLFDDFANDRYAYNNLTGTIPAKIRTLEEDLASTSDIEDQPATHTPNQESFAYSASRNEARRVSQLHVGKQRRVRSAITQKECFFTPPMSPTPRAPLISGDMMRPTIQVPVKRASTYSAHTLTSGITSTTTPNSALSLSSAPSSPFSANQDSSSLFERAIGLHHAGINGTYPETPDSSAAGSPPPLNASKIRHMTGFADLDATVCLPALSIDAKSRFDSNDRAQEAKDTCSRRNSAHSQSTATISRHGSMKATKGSVRQYPTLERTTQGTGVGVDKATDTSQSADDDIKKISIAEDAIPVSGRDRTKANARRSSVASFISVSGMDIHTHTDAQAQSQAHKGDAPHPSNPQTHLRLGRRPGLRPLPSTLFLSQATATSALTATTTTAAAAAATSAVGVKGTLTGAKGVAPEHGKGHAVLSGLASAMKVGRAGVTKRAFNISKPKVTTATTPTTMITATKMPASPTRPKTPRSPRPKKTRSTPRMRPTGVNQEGSLFWVGAGSAGVEGAVEGRKGVTVDMVDEEALRECLQG